MVPTARYLLLSDGKVEKLLSWGPALNDAVTPIQGGHQLHNTLQQNQNFMHRNLGRCNGPAKATQGTIGKASGAFGDNQAIESLPAPNFAGNIADRPTISIGQMEFNGSYFIMGF